MIDDPQLREELADLAHQQWSGWMQYLFDKGHFSANGVWVMPKEFVKRWTRQMNTPYAQLSENEKESDRQEADKFIAVVEARLKLE